jgi:HPt (histidine-containing phosphotransfer) domain-containing protein
MPDTDESPMQQQLTAIWQRNQPNILKRLATLDQAAAASDSGVLTPELKLEAADIAHKLAGSLGMFGFHEGTQKARELEHHFEAPAVPTVTLTAFTAELRQSLFPTSDKIKSF